MIIKKIRKKVAGSLNTKMPINTVPTAPIPVHTAYAVPIGSVCVAFIKSIILIDKVIKKPAYHKYISFPVASLAFPKQNANATSNRPAKIKIIKFMCLLFKLLSMMIPAKNRRWFVHYKFKFNECKLYSDLFQTI